jgi:tetratricopeptide (TPR) repeat protein
MPPTFDLFLSHNSRDKPAVREIAEALRGRKIRVWLDEDELIPGRPWQEALEEIIETARAAAVLVGKDGLGPWEDREMRACLSEFVDRELPVIPVLLPGAPAKPKLPLFLRAFTWVDLRSGITDRALDRLVRGVPKAKKKSSSKPVPPGAPPLHNLPYSPLGDLLKGRDAELAELAESLQGDGKARAIVQDQRALYGLGGIGKTRLAVEYAWRFGSRYSAAFFVRAESPESLNNGLASLAILLGLPERQAQAEAVQTVLLWIQKNPGWLFILDNVDTKEAQRAVLDILPRLAGGHVLITSRLRDWPRTVSKQELDTVSLEEARAFLLKRTEGERRTAANDEAQAWELAEKLDGLPLALEQAGAYISHTRLSFAEYLKVWDEEKARVLDWHDETMGYPASVATTWKASFDRLQPTAATLLRLMAFLAPEPILEEMFESEKEAVKEAVELLRTEIGQGDDRGVIREALAELESYSLISREDLACTVHRVVQEVVQSRIPAERRREWIEGALKVVNGYAPFDADDVRTWPVWNALQPHAARIVLFADEDSMADPTARLMSQLALFLNTRSLYAEAEPLMRRALAIDETSFGNEHPNVARELNNLASLLQATNRFSEAEPLMRQALAIDEASFGNEHPNVAIRLNNLAQLLQATNRLSEAEPLMRQALAIDEASFGNDHPKVAIRLNNLALLLRATNRLSEAEPLMRRAVEIWEKSLGPDHPNTQIGQRNLARLLAEIVGAGPTLPLEET